jgi:hypothetical protein
MVNATLGLPEEAFPTPVVQYLSVAVDVTQRPYCLPNPFTLPQNVGVLEFIAGTEPTSVCTTPTSVGSVIVPSVVGLSQDEAAGILESAGFYVQVRPEDSTQPPGTAIYQSPTGGTNALQTSTITLTVATDPAPTG